MQYLSSAGVILVCLLALSPAVVLPSPSASPDPDPRNSKQLLYSQLLFPNLHGQAAAVAVSPSFLGASALSSNKFNYLSQSQQQQPYYTTLWPGSQPQLQQRKLDHQNSV